MAQVIQPQMIGMDPQQYRMQLQQQMLNTLATISLIREREASRKAEQSERNWKNRIKPMLDSFGGDMAALAIASPGLLAQHLAIENGWGKATKMVEDFQKTSISNAGEVELAKREMAKVGVSQTTEDVANAYQEAKDTGDVNILTRLLGKTEDESEKSSIRALINNWDASAQTFAAANDIRSSSEMPSPNIFNRLREAKGKDPLFSGLTGKTFNRGNVPTNVSIPGKEGIPTIPDREKFELSKPEGQSTVPVGTGIKDTWALPDKKEETPLTEEQKAALKETAKGLPEWMQKFFNFGKDEEEDEMSVEADGRVAQMDAYNKATGDVHRPVMVGDQEIIMNKEASKQFAPLLTAINQAFPNPDAAMAPDSYPMPNGKESPVAAGGLGFLALLQLLQSRMGNEGQQQGTNSMDNLTALRQQMVPGALPVRATGDYAYYNPYIGQMYDMNSPNAPSRAMIDRIAATQQRKTTDPYGLSQVQMQEPQQNTGFLKQLMDYFGGVNSNIPVRADGGPGMQPNQPMVQPNQYIPGQGIVGNQPVNPTTPLPTGTPMTGGNFPDPRTGQVAQPNYSNIPIEQLAAGISAGTIRIDDPSISTEQLAQVQQMLEQEAATRVEEQEASAANRNIYNELDPPEGILFVSPDFYAANRDKYEMAGDMFGGEDPGISGLYNIPVRRIADSSTAPEVPLAEKLQARAPSGKTFEGTEEQAPKVSETVQSAITKAGGEEPQELTNKEKGAINQAAPKAKRWLSLHRSNVRGAVDSRQLEYIMDMVYPEGLDAIDIMTDYVTAQRLKQDNRQLDQADRRLDLSERDMERAERALAESLSQFEREMDYKWTTHRDNIALQELKNIMAVNTKTYKEMYPEAWENAKVIDARHQSKLQEIAKSMKLPVTDEAVSVAYGDYLSKNPSALDEINQALTIIGEATQNPILQQYVLTDVDPKDVFGKWQRFRLFMGADPTAIFESAQVTPTETGVGRYERTSRLNPYSVAGQQLVSPEEQTTPTDIGRGVTSEDILSDYE